MQNKFTLMNIYAVFCSKTATLLHHAA